ncbi:MAG: helix-turn-helix domain-containing protein [Ignavibacterium sp.]|nr:helix-turn-helix domain-containing protein [Ignavibacterium sp.]
MEKQIQHQLNKIESILNSIQTKETEFMDINEASSFLKLKKTTIYQMVFKREIPFYKSTKKLLFKKSDLIEWVEKDRIYTIEELQSKLNTTIN